jgi:hypothetical protein
MRAMGKEYIIEIEEIPFEKPEVFIQEDRFVGRNPDGRLYRAVGFSSLVFTLEQLERLTPLEEYEVGKESV